MYLMDSAAEANRIQIWNELGGRRPEEPHLNPVEDEPRGRTVGQGAGPKRPACGRVQVGPVRREDIVRPRRIRERLRDEGDVRHVPPPTTA